MQFGSLNQDKSHLCLGQAKTKSQVQAFADAQITRCLELVFQRYQLLVGECGASTSWLRTTSTASSAGFAITITTSAFFGVRFTAGIVNVAAIITHIILIHVIEILSCKEEENEWNQVFFCISQHLVINQIGPWDNARFVR